ncbi:MAG TPA: serine/threonine-protein kinase [Myxococcaceae bacterium]|jgi:serine/threonine-protein kinase
MANDTFIPETPREQDEMLGRQLGSFRLARRLGSGGMGSVYLARHVVIGSQVALKVLHPTLGCDQKMLERFYDEARAVNMIGHENILRIHDLCREGDLHYLVMEYLDGQPLSRMPMPMEAADAAPVLMQLCDALGAAHARGVVHRDVKPENIMLLQRSGQPPFVKLLDFGVAKLLESATHQTMAGFIVGTPSYMAPEQFRAEQVDGRTDLYALGVISYRLATGKLPFRQKDPAELMRAVLDLPPVSPAALRPGLDPRWSEITVRALAKRPEDRYPDAKSFRADLQSLLAEPPPQPRRVTPVPAPPPRSARPSLRVDVAGAGGVRPCTTEGLELSVDGVFLAAAGFAPPLFSPLRITIHGPAGGVLPLDCEVVRPVSAQQAAAWTMSEGAGVQFIRRTAEQRRALEALLRGEPVPLETRRDAGEGDSPVNARGNTPVNARGNTPANARANTPANASGNTPPNTSSNVLAILGARASRAGADPYVLLDVALDASASAVRNRACELRRALRYFQAPGAAKEQCAEADALMDRIVRAAQTLADPVRRAELDAPQGNVAGVERAMADGLSEAEMDQLHRTFQKNYPRKANRAALEAAAGCAHEMQRELEAAAAAYERALRQDPLDRTLFQALSRLRRRKAERYMAAGQAGRG